MLPGIDGFEVCRRLRSAGDDIAVLMLTARDAVEDRIAGFDTGADDYLVKPFALEELLARVKALLRRRNPPDIAREVLVYDDLELDTATRQAKRGNRLIDLSTTEFELLLLFMHNPRLVLTRSLLMDRIWGSDFEGGPNVLEVYIGHLRAKLEKQSEKRLIQTITWSRLCTAYHRIEKEEYVQNVLSNTTSPDIILCFSASYYSMDFRNYSV